MTDEELITRLLKIDFRLNRAIGKSLDMNVKLKRWVTEEDLKQDILLRMVRACRDVQIQDNSHFIHLVLLQLRRSLIDFHRKLFGPNGWAINLKSDPKATKINKATREELTRSLAIVGTPVSTEDWIDFHESVELLAEDEKVVFEMFFYGGYNELEVATELECSTRTVRRLWKSSREKLEARISKGKPKRKKSDSA